MLTVINKGIPYNLFDRIIVSTTLDAITGSYTLDTSLKGEAELPFGIGDFITIKTDHNDNICSGFIEKHKGSITGDSSVVSMGGRDLLGDLVDSSVPPELSSSIGSIGLADLCQKVIDGLGIKAKIRNDVGNLAPFSDDEITSVDFSGSAGEFLQSFAKKRGVFLTTEGNGFLVLFRPPQTLAFPEALTEDSMLSRSFSYDTTRRYSDIVVGSEDNFAVTEVTDFSDATDRRASFTDKTIRSTRRLQIVADQNMTNAELEISAQEEINVRRANGFEFSCKVPSHRYKLGTLLQVRDKISNVSGIFLIKAITYTYELNVGSVSELVFCYPESYSGAGARTTERKSKMGARDSIDPDFTNQIHNSVALRIIYKDTANQ